MSLGQRFINQLLEDHVGTEPYREPGEVDKTAVRLAEVHEAGETARAALAQKAVGAVWRRQLIGKLFEGDAVKSCVVVLVLNCCAISILYCLHLWVWK